MIGGGAMSGAREYTFARSYTAHTLHQNNALRDARCCVCVLHPIEDMPLSKKRTRTSSSKVRATSSRRKAMKLEDTTSTSTSTAKVEETDDADTVVDARMVPTHTPKVLAKLKKAKERQLKEICMSENVERDAQMMCTTLSSDVGITLVSKKNVEDMKGKVAKRINAGGVTLSQMLPTDMDEEDVAMDERALAALKGLQNIMDTLMAVTSLVDAMSSVGSSSAYILAAMKQVAARGSELTHFKMPAQCYKTLIQKYISEETCSECWDNVVAAFDSGDLEKGTIGINLLGDGKGSFKELQLFKLVLDLTQPKSIFTDESTAVAAASKLHAFLKVVAAKRLDGFDDEDLPLDKLLVVVDVAVALADGRNDEDENVLVPGDIIEAVAAVKKSKLANVARCSLMNALFSRCAKKITEMTVDESVAKRIAAMTGLVTTLAEEAAGVDYPVDDLSNAANAIQQGTAILNKATTIFVELNQIEQKASEATLESLLPQIQVIRKQKSSMATKLTNFMSTGFWKMTAALLDRPGDQWPAADKCAFIEPLVVDAVYKEEQEVFDVLVQKRRQAYADFSMLSGLGQALYQYLVVFAYNNLVQLLRT